MSFKKEFGHYKILEEIGSGGMGKVYKAYDSQLNRTVAIKVMHTRGQQGRFLQEAKAMAKLKHPNIVAIYDMGKEEQNNYIAMEFIQGFSLAHILKGLSIRRSLNIMVKVALAVDYAHC